MLEIFGSKNCSRCKIIKKFFDSQDISYEYISIETLPEEVKEKLMKEAREHNVLSLPILILDGKHYSSERFKEVADTCK